MNRRDVLKGTVAAAAAAFAIKATADEKTSDTPSDFKNIEISKDGAVLLLRINIPPRNEVSMTTLLDINKGLDMAARDSSIGAVVITGSDKVFSAGAGGGSFQGPAEGEDTQSYVAREVFKRIEGFAKPVIAAVAGVSSNGGNELALSCDIRIAGESATFSQMELLVGVIPGFGGMQRLQRHIGLGRAMEMMMTGRTVDAKEALTMGLVTSVVPDAEVVAKGIAMGKQLAENLNKQSIAVFKTRMAVSYDEPFGVALRNDQLAFDHIVGTDEAKAAIQRFIKKQSAKK